MSEEKELTIVKSECPPASLNRYEVINVTDVKTG